MKMLINVHKWRVNGKFLLIAGLCLCGLMSGCGHNYTPQPAGHIPGLKEVYADHFLIGSMIQDVDISRAFAVIKKHYSIVTINRFYWIAVHPELNQYNFSPVDDHLDFAEKYGLKVRGHTLLFGTLDPAWIFQENGKEISRVELIKRMKEHIQTVVSRYKGRIDYWDVVNEPTADIFYNLDAGPSSPGDDYKQHAWYRIIGKDYLELALRYAHAADPAARLYINENNIAGWLGKRKADHFYRIVSELIQKGVPLHGVGIQGHFSTGYPGVSSLQKVIKRFADLGLDVQITELDITTYPITRWVLPGLVRDNKVFTRSLEKKQVKRYYEIFKGLRESSDKISAVIFWGISDKTSWLRTIPSEKKDWPLLFDDFYQPKQAFWAVVDFP